MKKKFKIIISLFVIFLLTGCVNYDVTMQVNKDKSMNLTIIESTADEYFDEDSEEEKENLKQYEKAGFYIEKFKEDGKTGYKLTKKINNIDNVSTDAQINTEQMTDALFDENGSMFMIKKGFFKSTYKASYLLPVASYMNADTLGNNDIGVEDYDETCVYEYSDNSTSISCGFEPVADQVANKAKYDAYVAAKKQESEKLKKLMADSSAKFTLKLPYKVKSSNSFNVSDGGKTLIWDLAEQPQVEFEFELYNMTYVYIGIGIGAVVLLMIIGVIIMKMKKPPEKNQPITNYPESTGFLKQMEDYEQQRKETVEKQQAIKEEMYNNTNKFIVEGNEPEEEVKEVAENVSITDVYNSIPLIQPVQQAQVNNSNQPTLNTGGVDLLASNNAVNQNNDSSNNTNQPM